MQPDSNAQKHSHKHHSPTTNGEQCDAGKNQGNKIESIHPDMNWILHQVWSVTLQHRSFMLLRCPAQYPTHVRPPTAIARRVRISGCVSMRMMNAMSCYPIDSASFQSKGATEC